MGPFAHMLYARQGSAGLLGARDAGQRARLETALFAGALAPDAGYYPGGEPELSHRVHLERPWDFCRELWQAAGSPLERAFALGWLSHAQLDCRGHGEVINPRAGRRPDPVLGHKRLEWGLDCWILSQDWSGWLRRARPDPQAGLDLWRRALMTCYGWDPGVEVLGRSLRAELVMVARLPRIWLYSGRLRPARPGVGTWLGRLVGATLRPLYVSLLRRLDRGLDQRAILDPRWPDRELLRQWRGILAEAQYDLGQLVHERRWPGGDLDLNPGKEAEADPAPSPPPPPTPPPAEGDV